MRLRKLKIADIPLMLEWMHDKTINQYFRFNASSVDEKVAADFIKEAQQKLPHLHLACVDDEDTYLGTISLKHIDHENKTAEYAISFRRAAQGSGAARYATAQILKIAFKELQLEKVYLEVLEENTHACHFYEKQGFVKEGTLRSHIVLRGVRRNLRLYAFLREMWKVHERG